MEAPSHMHIQTEDVIIEEEYELMHYDGCAKGADTTLEQKYERIRIFTKVEKDNRSSLIR